MIEHIQGYQAYDAHARLSRVKAKAELSQQRCVADTYEPARDVPDDRLKLLNSVRQRIKSGFYNSDEVIDDLGDSFAKAFDQAL